ncbi:ATP-binding protein [Arthrobacter sp. StoSoilB13]|uniref:ATP-binding protein n=1 Tax=Arthrobacter sp. StoSoilB13 TaxID=2830993 RepID=UPI001CC80876|nr:ATP-binding protein [Arthrobacter sp. StoSoilB13]
MSTDVQDSLFTLEEQAHDGALPPGFRLQRLELLNWGTFHGGVRTFRLDGANSLLTGDIGSGKSTVVDAITTLLLPANRIEYNKAAGAQKRERTLMSYVRGFHKSTRSTGGEYSKPVALRAPGTLTVVLGVFHNDVVDKTITLGITLWTMQEAGQPTRFYSLAETEQSIAEDFSNFGQDPAKLKKKLRAAGGERPRYLRPLRCGLQAALWHQRQPGHGFVPPHGFHEAGGEHHPLRPHQHVGGR